MRVFLLTVAVALGVCAVRTSISSAQDDAGFKSIFNGKTLDGWRGDRELWRLEDGAIVGESTAENPLKSNRFLVWDQGEIDDFILKLKFKISGTERANSGVQIRSSEPEGGHLVGYQLDIDRSGAYIGAVYSEKTGRGILAPRGKKVTIRAKNDKLAEPICDPEEILKNIDVDEWVDMEILAQGPHIQVKMNGVVTSELIDQSDQLVRQGLLGLQLHQGPPMKIQFKDIQLKRLPLADGTKKIVFLAGKRSHGYGAHEHNAGCLLLAKGLNEAAANRDIDVLTTVYQNGWPDDPTALDNADTVVVYCDGGKRHFLHQHGEAFEDVMRRGVGLVCLHFGVEIPKGPSGQRFLDWIGGYFEANWSVNPHWTAEFKSLPEHPVTNGVQPFEILDEWYYHMRFVPEMSRVTPVLSALPPKESLSRKDGSHSNNPHVREAVLEKKQPQHVGWAFVRGDGQGRGFGFTGGHFHNNWQNEDFRKLVLNAIVWTAHEEVPEDGVESKPVTDAELAANQDYPPPKKEKKDN